MTLPKRKVVFQPSIFRCYVDFREGDKQVICNATFSLKECKDLLADQAWASCPTGLAAAKNNNV